MEEASRMPVVDGAGPDAAGGLSLEGRWEPHVRCRSLAEYRVSGAQPEKRGGGQIVDGGSVAEEHGWRVF